MSYTDVQIVNMALSQIGESQVVTIADKVDINLQNIYDQSRDELQSDFPWNFGRTRIYLTPKTYTAATIAFTTTPTITDSASVLITTGGFRNGDLVEVSDSTSNDGTYTIVTAAEGTLTLLSTDVLVAESAGASVTLERQPANEFGYSYDLPSDYLGFPSLEGGAFFIIDGDRIITNEYEIYLMYSRTITDPAYFTSLFIKCLALKLAARLAVTISNDLALADALEKKLKAELYDSYSVNAHENYPDETRSDTTWQSFGR